MTSGAFNEATTTGIKSSNLSYCMFFSACGSTAREPLLNFFCRDSALFLCPSQAIKTETKRKI